MMNSYDKGFGNALLTTLWERAKRYDVNPYEFLFKKEMIVVIKQDRTVDRKAYNMLTLLNEECTKLNLFGNDHKVNAVNTSRNKVKDSVLRNTLDNLLAGLSRVVLNANDLGPNSLFKFKAAYYREALAASLTDEY